MFSAGGKLVFTGRQKHFELLCKKKLPLDGQNRRAKSSPQPVNLHGALP